MLPPLRSERYFNMVAAPGVSEHDDFGEIIAERRRGFGELGAIGLVCSGAIASLYFGVAMLNSRLPHQRDLAIVLLFVGALCVVLAAFGVRSYRTTTEFRVLGVCACRGGKRLRSMAYADCERFTYSITRQYVNGIYTGTSLVVKLQARGKKTIKWTGSHKQKPVGLSYTILGKGEFKGEDELDVVKLIIADAMADRWIDRLLGGESIAWGKLTLDATTATPKRGKRKGQLIPFADIDRLSFNEGWLHLFHKGEDRSFFSMQMNDENFWPGMRVIERMWHTNALDEADGTIES